MRQHDALGHGGRSRRELNERGTTAWHLHRSLERRTVWERFQVEHLAGPRHRRHAFEIEQRRDIGAHDHGAGSACGEQFA